MAKLVDYVVGWQTFWLLLLVYGFAPGFVLRIILLAYRREDPNRRELLAELYKMPRHARPFWVVEQLETAMFESGLPQRILASAVHAYRRVRRVKDTSDSPERPTERRKRAIPPRSPEDKALLGKGILAWVTTDRRLRQPKAAEQRDASTDPIENWVQSLHKDPKQTDSRHRKL